MVANSQASGVETISLRSRSRSSVLGFFCLASFRKSSAASFCRVENLPAVVIPCCQFVFFAIGLCVCGNRRAGGIARRLRQRFWLVRRVDGQFAFVHRVSFSVAGVAVHAPVWFRRSFLRPCLPKHPRRCRWKPPVALPGAFRSSRTGCLFVPCPLCYNFRASPLLPVVYFRQPFAEFSWNDWRKNFRSAKSLGRFADGKGSRLEIEQSILFV